MLFMNWINFLSTDIQECRNSYSVVLFQEFDKELKYHVVFDVSQKSGVQVAISLRPD